VLPIWGGAAAVTALVAGYLGYGAAERATFTSAVAAQATGDGVAAVPAFDAVAGIYRLTRPRTAMNARPTPRRAWCRTPVPSRLPRMRCIPIDGDSFCVYSVESGPSI
jgi:hypothetical protein